MTFWKTVGACLVAWLIIAAVLGTAAAIAGVTLFSAASGQAAGVIG
jgi:hypothetical protein